MGPLRRREGFGFVKEKNIEGFEGGSIGFLRFLRFFNCVFYKYKSGLIYKNFKGGFRVLIIASILRIFAMISVKAVRRLRLYKGG